MAKTSGGTRNYSSSSRTLSKRRGEYDSLMNSGDYDKARSSFSRSGGFVATHNGHDQITDKKKDKSDVASKKLAKKGYRIYLDNERTTISDNGKKRDGRIEKLPMDIKTISEAGKHTIKGAIERAAKQNAKAVILYQNTPSMTKSYVYDQLYGENGFIAKSPLKAVNQIEWVIVVGKSGNIHHDYRFGDSLYQHPEKILQQNPANIVEPNYSLFQETPIAFGIQAIYKKRMIARALQDKGIRVFVDMNVAGKWYQFNMLGVPRGWTAYCTRGYADRIDYLKFEVNLARYWADGSQILFVVYGGGQDVKQVCKEEGLVYVNPTLKMKKNKEEMKKIGETVAFFGQKISLSTLNPGLDELKKEMEQIEDFTKNDVKSLESHSET